MNRESILGMTVWLALLAIAPWFHGIGTVERLFLLAPLVIVPLGFSLLLRGSTAPEKPTLLTRAMQLQPVAALILVVSFSFDPKWPGALLTLPWVAVCALAALYGLTNLLQRGYQFDSVVLLFATSYLFVGSCWLFFSRAGMNPVDFQEPIVLLTAVHFHYSGFAAVVLTGRLAARCTHDRRLLILARAFCTGTILAMALIAAGFVISLPLKVISIFFLAACLGGAALLTLWISPELRPQAARTRLRISAGSIVAGMALAALYGVGEFTGHPAINLHEMAMIHGTLNALGFSFCGLWGWNLLSVKEAS